MPATPSSAAALPRLHVDALSMRADRAQMQVGETFHLAIHVHVREPVTRLDELVIPDVGTMQLLGDERNVSTSPSGADVVETLTLEPTQAGTFTFAGAYLDAIDARTGKPSRFSSNPVRVVVAAKRSDFFGSWWAATKLIAALALGGTILLALLAAVVSVVRLRRGDRPVVDVAPPVAPPQPPPGRTSRDAVAEALHAYRASPANGSLLRLRAALFEAAGANAGWTLRDALKVTHDAALRDALVAAEHAAFGPAQAREASSEALMRTTEGWLR
ncbi:MAG TPA: hypothetical protein VK665_03000 [Candidatus Elarobacter sp.]|nr:hypothetical protein [Candidatus Elarobacter sp.]